MKYMGNKNRLSKELVPIIQKYIDESGYNKYLEPFCGGCGIIDKIRCEHRFGSDIHKYLIAFLKALSNGYEPPYDISEVEYKHIKEHQSEYPDELLGYVGFQLSFGAKWFDSFRRDKQGKRNYSHEAYRNVMKQAPNLKGIKFNCCDFRTIKNISNFVIYCDPPYRGTTKYAVDEFPYKEFYDWCREMSKDNIVLVSEYYMPDDFECIWSKETKVLIDSNKVDSDSKNNRVEKLFIYNK